MRGAKRKPCVECPFRNNCLPGWLGPWKDAAELHRFVMSENALACHMTVKEDDEDSENVEHCVGSILYMNKNAKLCSDKTMRELQTEFKGEDISNILSSPDFFEHHSTPLGKKRK